MPYGVGNLPGQYGGSMPDFSDVRRGATSTAPIRRIAFAPGAPPPRQDDPDAEFYGEMARRNALDEQRRRGMSMAARISGELGSSDAPPDFAQSVGNYGAGKIGLMDIGRGSQDWLTMSPAERTAILSQFSGG